MNKPLSKGRITLYVLMSLFSIMVILVAAVLFYIWNGLRPVAAGEVVRVEIAKGSSPNKVAELLEQEGIIRNAFLFKYYLRYINEGPAFKAGVYDISPGMSNETLIAKLNSGDTVKAETFRFTIPEGYTVLQIAEKLGAEQLVDSGVFMELVQSPSMLPYSDASSQLVETEGLRYLLEGYLFPETYEMKKDSTEQEMIIRMQQELDRKLNQLPDGWMEDMQERGVTFHEMMTIASLIEREVVVEEERAIVSGIIYNRLRVGMPLQIDATVQYLLDKPKERLFEKDLEVESPYNTYKIKGLPPGPIASPSIDAIRAAIYPEETEYFYYVTKKDGSQTHLFGKTLNEHNRNIQQSNKNAQGG